MADQYLGQLMLVGFNFAPYGWQEAAGQILPISQYSALFSLLGTYYGGNGTSNFGLPNLQGAVAIGYGQGAGLSDYSLGESGGNTTVTLNVSEVPAHLHTVMAKSAPATLTAPANNSFGEPVGLGNLYTNTPVQTGLPMSNAALGPPVGGNQPHGNMMPYLTLNWIICMAGVFPPRN
jgi:microcystin-dependent protein